MTSDTAYETINSLLVAHLRALPVKHLRILHATEATSILTDETSQRVLGIRFKRHNVNSLDGKAKETDANIFGDAIVFSLRRELLATLCSNALAKVEDHRAVMGEGKILEGLFLAKDVNNEESTSLNSFIDVARLAGNLLN